MNMATRASTSVGVKHRKLTCCASNDDKSINTKVSRAADSTTTTTSTSSRRKQIAASLIAVPTTLLASNMSYSNAQSSTASAPATVDTTITDKVFIELGICSKLNNRYAPCISPEPYGRLVIGLYGNYLPQTVDNFKRAIQNEVYMGTSVNSIVTGEYIRLGRQGSPNKNEVDYNQRYIKKNAELTSSQSFNISHLYPGTVSWAVQQNDDPEGLRQRSGYASSQFLITLGPGPTTQLDGSNIAFGRVIEGMETLDKLNADPTSKPDAFTVAMNQLAEVAGDYRYKVVRQTWQLPYKPIRITSMGLVQ